MMVEQLFLIIVKHRLAAQSNHVKVKDENIHFERVSNNRKEFDRIHLDAQRSLVVVEGDALRRCCFSELRDEEESEEENQRQVIFQAQACCLSR